MHFIILRTIIKSLSCCARAFGKTIPGDTLEGNLVIKPATNETNLVNILGVMNQVIRLRYICVIPSFISGIPNIGFTYSCGSFNDTNSFWSYFLTITRGLGPRESIICFHHGVRVRLPYRSNNHGVGLGTIDCVFSQDVQFALGEQVETVVYSVLVCISVSEEAKSTTTNLVVKVFTLSVNRLNFARLLTSVTQQETTSHECPRSNQDLETTISVGHYYTGSTIASSDECVLDDISWVRSFYFDVSTNFCSTIDSEIKKSTISNRRTIRGSDNLCLAEIHLEISTSIDDSYCQRVTPHAGGFSNEAICFVLAEVVLFKVTFILNIWTSGINFTNPYDWIRRSVTHLLGVGVVSTLIAFVTDTIVATNDIANSTIVEEIANSPPVFKVFICRLTKGKFQIVFCIDQCELIYRTLGERTCDSSHISSDCITCSPGEIDFIYEHTWRRCLNNHL